MMRAETALETIHHLHRTEEKTNYILCDYFQRLNPKTRGLLQTRRLEICSWMYRFADTNNICRDLVSRAMSYFDRFVTSLLMSKENLGSPTRVNESSFLQLIALIALNLAIKMHSALQWDLKYMIEASRGNFDLTELIDMERRMLCALSWRLNFPTSAEFVLCLGSLLLSATDRSLKKYLNGVIDCAIFLTELVVWDSYFLEYKASTIAIACLLNAAESLSIIQQDRNDYFSSMVLNLDSLDMIPSGVNLHLVRSRVQEVFSRSEHSEKFQNSLK